MSKTGSTALQNALTENSEKLNANGILYPEPHSNQGNIRKIVKAIQQDDIPQARQLVEGILSKANGFSKIILSSEYMYYLIIDSQRRCAIFEILREFGVPYEAISCTMLVRDIHSHAFSAYSHISGNSITPPFPEWIKHQTSRSPFEKKGGDYYELWGDFLRWSECLEPLPVSMSFLNYSDVTIESVLRVLDPSLDDLVVLPRNNSVSLDQARLLSVLSRQDAELAVKLRHTFKSTERENETKNSLAYSFYCQLIDREIECIQDQIDHIQSFIGLPLVSLQAPPVSSAVDAFVNLDAVAITPSQLNILIEQAKESMKFRSLLKRTVRQLLGPKVTRHLRKRLNRNPQV